MRPSGANIAVAARASSHTPSRPFAKIRVRGRRNAPAKMKKPSVAQA
jgi:hypothetical protein